VDGSAIPIDDDTIVLNDDLQLSVGLISNVNIINMAAAKLLNVDDITDDETITAIGNILTFKSPLNPGTNFQIWLWNGGNWTIALLQLPDVPGVLPISKIEEPTNTALPNQVIKWVVGSPGAWNFSQLAFTDITGTATLDQIPTITNAKLGDLSVSTSKIQDSAVTNAKLENLAVGTTKLADSAVIEVKLASNAVTNAKIQDFAVTETKIGGFAVTSDKLGGGSVISSKIADSAVTTFKIANLAVTAAKIDNATITGTKIAAATIVGSNMVLKTITNSLLSNGTTDGQVKVYRTTGSGSWVDELLSGDSFPIGSINGDRIASATITETQLGIPCVSETRLFDGAVTDAKIEDATISNAKLKAAVTPHVIKRWDATGSQWLDDKIINDNITDSTITGTKLANATVTGAKIAATTIAAGNVVLKTITNALLSNGSANGQVKVYSTASGGSWSDSTIITDSITNLAVTDAKIANLTITGGKIANNTITATKLTNGTSAGQMPTWDGAAWGYALLESQPQRLRLSTSVVGTCGVFHDANQGTGLYLPSSTGVNLAVNGVNRLTLDTANAFISVPLTLTGNSLFKALGGDYSSYSVVNYTSGSSNADVNPTENTLYLVNLSGNANRTFFNFGSTMTVARKIGVIILSNSTPTQSFVLVRGGTIATNRSLDGSTGALEKNRLILPGDAAHMVAVTTTSAVTIYRDLVPHYCTYQRTTALSVGAGAFVQIALTTAYNNAGPFRLVSSQVEVQRGGVYRATVQGSMQGTVGFVYATLQLNSGSVAGCQCSNHLSYFNTTTLTFTLALARGDLVTLAIQNGDSVSRNLNTGATWVSLEEVV